MKKRTHFHIARLSVENSRLPGSIPVRNLIYEWAFYLGTILPDLTVTQFVHPHYYERSSGYVFGRLNRLIGKPVKGITDAIISGEIVHYLCDYCCYAHIGGSIGKVSEHLDYERGIHKYLMDNYQSYQWRIFGNLSCGNPGGIAEQVQHGLAEYRRMEPGYDWDIMNSIRMAALIYQGLLLDQADTGKAGPELKVCKEGIR